MRLASCACAVLLGSPVALLNFLSQLLSVGRGVDLFGVGYEVYIQVAMCFSNTLSMKVLMVILM